MISATRAAAAGGVGGGEVLEDHALVTGRHGLGAAVVHDGPHLRKEPVVGHARHGQGGEHMSGGSPRGDEHPHRAGSRRLRAPRSALDAREWEPIPARATFTRIPTAARETTSEEPP